MTVAPVAAAAVLVLEAMVVGRHTSESPKSVESAAGRPFALAPAVLLAAVLIGAVLAARWAREVDGASGAQLAATLTGVR